ncbi:hypothetical protein ACI3LY_001235 [Candidozyma auris]|uniref:GH16 domain-containing protein n=2 Tax=Candidozyma auris TaxID=498019 RepID=A0A2H0ZJT0_CANAR|nr:hypothetical protein QG37_04654 [[Candida] auris]PIS50483.1 hypothetical protein B9J08_004308 [[Candida] auris]QWW25521.1 hypothetical protein CA7LBN_004408 [[Candida] auris]
MMSKLRLFWILSAAALTVSSSPCNPTQDKSCVAQNDALSTAVFEPLTKAPTHLSSNVAAPSITFGAEGAKMRIFERGENSQLFSTSYILYGRAEAQIRASHGKGVISSMYMQSDDLDEIDVAEFFGGEPHKFQTNYFVKGNISNYDRDRYHNVYDDLTQEWHTFGVEWTPEAMFWYYNGQIVRRVRSAHNTQGFPSSPMQLKFSLWVGGEPKNHPGTIEWAGGEADWKELPYEMGIRNVRLVDYSSGEKYVYGSGQDLTAHRGQVFGKKKRDSSQEKGEVGNGIGSVVDDEKEEMCDDERVLEKVPKGGGEKKTEEVFEGSGSRVQSGFRVSCVVSFMIYLFQNVL